MTVSPHIPSDRDLELLSAYLDGELTDLEKEQLEQRLARESTLRADLNDLRQTVALVRDLPRLKAPRNFTLDPAVYGRPVPWWQRLFTLRLGLQLSGALGAVASVLLIILAVLLTQSGSENASQSAGRLAASESAQVAMQATLAQTQVEATALAYAGDDVLQATMLAQNMYYATLDATSTQAALDMAAPAGEESYQTAASAPTEEAQEMAAGAVAPAESETHLAPQNEEPAPLMAQPGTSPSVGAQDAVGGAAPPPAAAAPLPDVAAVTATPPPPTAAPQAAASEGTFREDQRDENTQEGDGAAANSVMNSPTSAAETMLLATPTPAPDTQMEKDRSDKTPSPARAARSSSYWWLAGIGVVTLVFSIVLFAWGNRRARP
jgi:hypothetical protein